MAVEKNPGTPGAFFPGCAAYHLDPLEICELMRLKIYEDFLLREFRRGCQKEGKSPGGVLYELMAGYAVEMSKRPFK